MITSWSRDDLPQTVSIAHDGQQVYLHALSWETAISCCLRPSNALALSAALAAMAHEIGVPQQVASSVPCEPVGDRPAEIPMPEDTRRIDDLKRQLTKHLGRIDAVFGKCDVALASHLTHVGYENLVREIRAILGAP